MSRDTVTPIIEAARMLADTIDEATVTQVKTHEGRRAALIDEKANTCCFPYGTESPIRDAAARLREALLDHEILGGGGR